MRCRKAVWLLLAGSLSAQTLPDGAGKEATRKICGNCHEITTVISSRRTKIAWEQMVDDMITRGAEGSDADMETVVAYLTANFGKVNVNIAAAADLQKALGLSENEAQALTSYRAKNGNYKNFEDLAKTPGLDAEKLRQKRSLIAFTQ
jgi:competence ComEA-like helix-hairpin-helix protein